jgi:hypothetical protein
MSITISIPPDFGYRHQYPNETSPEDVGSLEFGKAQTKVAGLYYLMENSLQSQYDSSVSAFTVRNTTFLELADRCKISWVLFFLPLIIS